MKWVVRYLTYFSSYLVCNVLLLGLYANHVFTEHNHCMTKNGIDVTKSFEFSFNLGFTLLAIDGFNTNILNIFLQFKVITQRDNPTLKETCLYKMLVASSVLEWLLRFSILAVSLIQFLTNH